MRQLTKEQAKSFMIGYHFINTNELRGEEGIKTIFNRIQSIQYDPLDVVGRNSELVLQSRISNFKKKMLYDSLYQERFLIDGWDKMMGIYKTEDFSKFTRIRESRAKGEIEVFKYRLQIEAIDHVEKVLEIIKENGPTFSKDISIGESKKHRWGRTKPSSATIDYLFHAGVIGVHSRKGATKCYDILENLIGEEARASCPYKTDEEFILYYLLRRIQTMGLVWNKSSVAFSGLFINNKKLRSEYIEKLLSKNLIEEIKIEGINELFYTPYGALDNEYLLKDRMSFIAPLDNLVWDRELIKKVFGFEYTWEVYTPVVKRKYGYYVLPIVYKNNFVGRIEFEKYRKQGDFQIKNIWWEPNIKQTKKLQTAFNSALKRFETYLK